MPSTDVMLREGSFALASFGRVRKVHETAFAVVFGRKSVALKRILEEAGCGLLRLKEGSLYPALYRLEAAGEVKAVWESEPHCRRGARRRFYTLTAKGQRKLDAGRVEWERFVRIIGGILRAPA